MADIVIYSTTYCPYCQRAKDLLKRKGQTYREIDVTDDEKLRNDMVEKAGGKRTVPQIFIDGRHVGGFDDLNRLDKEGNLDLLLAA